MNLRDLFATSSAEVAFGVVTDDVPLTVRFNGEAAADAQLIPLKNDDYTPTIGDEVMVFKVGADLIVGFSYS